MAAMSLRRSFARMLPGKHGWPRRSLIDEDLAKKGGNMTEVSPSIARCTDVFRTPLLPAPQQPSHCKTSHSQDGEKSALSRNPQAPYRPRKSQEVLRHPGSETGFRTISVKAQSGAQSKKPRVVLGFGRLQIAVSELRWLVLAEKEGFEPSIRRTVYRISSPDDIVFAALD